MKLYMKTYRELVRLESVTNSPLITHLSETLSGSTTIRNYGKEEDFIQANYNKMNESLNASFWGTAVKSWFTIRIELIGRLIIILTMALMV